MTGSSVCLGYTPDAMAAFRPVGFIGLPVQLASEYVLQVTTPGQRPPDPPKWCPLKLHNFEIKYVEWPGNLWPKDIGQLPEHAWKPMITYYPRQIVWADGREYVCMEKHVADDGKNGSRPFGLSPNPFWEVWQGEKGPVGEVWAADRRYDTGREVNHNGHRYRCLLLHASDLQVSQPGSGLEWGSEWERYWVHVMKLD